MGDIILDHVRQATDVMRRLEEQIRDAVASGDQIHSTQAHDAMNDFLCATVALYAQIPPLAGGPSITPSLILQPPTSPGQPANPPYQPPSVTGHQGTQAACPNCGYRITMT